MSSDLNRFYNEKKSWQYFCLTARVRDCSDIFLELTQAPEVAHSGIQNQRKKIQRKARPYPSWTGEGTPRKKKRSYL